ncbi:hypothetical protein [Sulfuracidifex metallicus]|uniref:hypothetical protein n=1 Tax=Sulfuracidifex metallicus TaxID=47303 RepID=UPI0022729578|nr:hypothetical protein [Sulfuracidifex metallicus]MCY0851036.1 hypothetical protein [Sulfuracidifex metallicus]
MARNYTQLVSPTPYSIMATASNNGSKLGVGSTVILNFVTDPTLPNQTTDNLRVPPSEKWLFYSVYTPSTPTGDGFVTIKINGISQNVQWGPLSQTVPTQYHVIPQNSRILAEPNDIVQMYLVLSNSGFSTTSAVSDTIYVNIMRIPKNYKGVVRIS